VVDAIVAQHSNVEVRALVRDEGKGWRLEQRYKSVRAVVGDLRDLDLIISESKAADIVISLSRKIPNHPNVA
jgi:hypothetical protein